MSEKELIRTVLAPFARTAAASNIDDCIIVDLADVTNDSNAPLFVYSIDHPSFIRRALDHAGQFEFYGGWVAAITCGDVLAMGSRPRGFSVDITMPTTLPLDDFHSLIRGLSGTLKHYGGVYEGGNLNEGALELVGVAYGLVDRKRIIRRSGAQVGDIVVATCALGTGWAGYTAEKRGLLQRLSPATRAAIVQYKIPPLAPIESLRTCYDRGLFTSGMDLSDGVIEFLYTINERNGHGVELDVSLWSPSGTVEAVAAVTGIPAAAYALEPGYDTPVGHGYTVRPERLHEVEEVFRMNQQPLTVLGRVTTIPTITFRDQSGKRHEIPPFWDDQSAKESVIERWESTIVESIFAGR